MAKARTKCCETCEYYCEYNENHVCVNRASDNMTKYMEPDDCCFEYERRETLTKDEIIAFMLENLAEQKRLISKLKECDAMNV